MGIQTTLVGKNHFFKKIKTNKREILPLLERLLSLNGKEYEKENKEEIIVNALKEFRHYLYEFFNKKETVRSEFRETDFYEALETYDYEEIIDAVPYDINGNFNDRRDMRTFFNKNGYFPVTREIVTSGNPPPPAK